MNIKIYVWKKFGYIITTLVILVIGLFYAVLCFFNYINIENLKNKIVYANYFYMFILLLVTKIMKQNITT